MLELGGEERDNALLAQTVQRQAVAATNTCLFEYVFQMDLDRSGADPEFLSNLAVLETLLDQLHNLVLAGG